MSENVTENVTEDVSDANENAQGVGAADVGLPDKFKVASVEDPVKGQAALVKAPARSNRAIGRALKKFKTISLTDSELRAFQDLGAAMDSAEMLKHARGGVSLAQQAGVRLLQDLGRIYAAASDKAKLKIVPHMTLVMGKLTAANKQMFDDGRTEIVATALGAAKPPQVFVPFQVNVSVNGEEKVIDVAAPEGQK